MSGGKSTAGGKRWPLDLKFRAQAEREIYNLQARLSCDPDERTEILKRIDQLKAILKHIDELKAILKRN